MHILNDPKKSFSKVQAKATWPLRPAMFAVALLTGSTAAADGLETAYVNAMAPYVVFKRGTLECDKPAGEYIAYKAHMLEILGRIPNIDLIAADREIERAFEREAPRTSYVECSDALLDRYASTMGRSADMALQYLAETVRDRLAKGQ